jgi:hypothetical protein
MSALLPIATTKADTTARLNTPMAINGQSRMADIFASSRSLSAWLALPRLWFSEVREQKDQPLQSVKASEIFF